MSSIRVLDGALVVCGLYLLKRVLSRRPPAPLPPGPKGLPLIGNLLDYPKEQRWITFSEWKEKYGDIIHLEILGQHIIVLNDSQLAIEMLDRKGNIYSERPFLYLASELVGWKDTIGLTPYGDRLRDIRRLLSKEIGTKKSLEPYATMSEAENVKFLRRVLDDPKGLQAHVRHLVSALILNISHGYQIQEHGDPWVELSEKLMNELAQVLEPGAYLVDFVPALNRLPDWFPGTGFKREAAAMRANMLEALNVPYEFVKEQLAKGIARPSFVATYLEGKTLSPYEENNLAHASMALYDAGSDTTISAICTLFLSLTMNPHVQKRARAEIDAIVGTDRLPGMSDRPRLPYVEALMKEVLRWQVIVPLCVAHALKEDDVHGGYFIPGGSYIVPNIYAFLHDPNTYRNPAEFDPTRFLSEDGREPERDPREFVFGFGRRICPGIELADNTLFLTCASVLATLDVQKERDDQGNEIVPVPVYSSGMISHPNKFLCSIKPRSARAEALVSAGDEAARWMGVSGVHLACSEREGTD